MFRYTFLIILFFHLTTNAQSIEYTPWKMVVPSEGIPKDVNLRKANNNLDIITYVDKYYLAFRTAPSHFASKKTRIYVLSSNDLNNWELEKEIHLKNDLREPRFIVYNNTLFFYYFEGGRKPWRFEPKHLYMSSKDLDGKWTKDNKTKLDGYIPWRLREHNGLIYMSAYYGKNAYNKDSVDLRLFISNNGIDFDPISKAAQIIHPLGIGEGEFLFDDNGDIWGVARSEFDGSHTFHGKKDALHLWTTKHSDYKFDSSLMFEKDGQIYLIARRNLDGDGRYVRKPGKHLKNLLRYSFTKKTTAIFKLDKANMGWIHLRDIEGTGDNAFPALIENKDGSFLLMNYSSKLTKRSKTWIRGQLGKTYIYMCELRIKP